MCKVCQAEGALLGEVDRVVLENTLPGHNKQYTIYLEEIGSTCLFRLMARYGPIGKWEKSVQKGGAMSAAEARTELQTLRRQKERKGYVERVCRE